MELPDNGKMNRNQTGYNLSNTDINWFSPTPRPVVPGTADSVVTTAFKIKVTFGAIGVAIVFISVIVYMITCYKSTPNKKKCQELEEKRVQIKLLPLTDPSELKKEPIRHKTARMQRLNSVRSGTSLSSGERTGCGYMCSTNGTSSTLVSNCLDDLEDIVDDTEEVKVQVEQLVSGSHGVAYISSPNSELVPLDHGRDSMGLLLQTQY